MMRGMDGLYDRHDINYSAEYNAKKNISSSNNDTVPYQQLLHALLFLLQDCVPLFV